MPLIAPLLVFLILFNLMISNVTTNNAKIQLNNTEVTAAGQNMLVYGTYAKKFAAANPGYTGAVPTVSIGFPTWFVPPPFVQNYVTSGKAYVYYTGPLKGVAYFLVSATQDGYRAGTNNNGVLVSPVIPANQTTSITIPAGVPNASTVLMP